MFLAIAITGTLLLIATSIASLAVRQSRIASSGRESQIAFYAADTGLECALYWDTNNPSGFSAFLPSTSSTIYCNRDNNNMGNQWIVGGNGVNTFTFTMTFNPDPYCAVVTVTKSGNTTRIESRGYNTCSATNPRRVERAVSATY